MMTFRLLFACCAFTSTISAGDLPSEVGQWAEPQVWPVTAIHAAVLPTGRVLHYAYPEGTPGTNAKEWDPISNTFQDVGINIDLFCSGHSMMADGRVFVTGGNNNQNCDFQGRPVSHIFDPFTHEWTQLQNMAVSRWYPTNVTLGDGRVMIFSGLDEFCKTTDVVEMFTPETQTIEVIPGAERFVTLYPRMHLLTNGLIAHVAEESFTYTYDPSVHQWQFIGFNNEGWRSQGTSVLIPGEPDNIMLFGGYGESGPHAACERIDFTQPNPTWQSAGSMNFGRAHFNAVILPDKTVFLIGGGTFDLYGGPIFTPELWDPSDGSFTLLPPHVYARMYHSTAVLLPDGRVLCAGQDSGASGFMTELYSPSYLFRGPRPEWLETPDEIVYGATFQATIDDTSDIGAVALIRPSSVTHSVNMEQRYVEVPFTVIDGSTLQLQAPDHGDMAPPGPYMLFAMTQDGVPTVANFVNLGVPSVAVPAASTWGLAVLTLLMLATGSFVFVRSRCAVSRS
ncbi:MAG: galactose oxidase-like domain-containing protein [Phycisphaerae bacterium]